jgi:heme/copper-type cytochrome/quinol oxidase subunit 1
MIGEQAGKLSFWILFVGFNLTCFPMHILGLNGMTRRIYTYAAESGWGNGNLLATCGGVLIALGGLVFIVNAWTSMRGPAAADGNPWDASTLEWATASPPPNYNFVYQPVVSSRTPLWSPANLRTVVTGMRNTRREVMVTGVTEAEPQFRTVLPGSSLWPFITAVGISIGLAGSVFAFSWYYLACALGAIGLIGWFWPRGPREIEP